MTAEKEIDSGGSSAPLMAKELVERHIYAYLSHHLLPGTCVARHGIIECAVHVDERGAEFEPRSTGSPEVAAYG